MKKFSKKGQAGIAVGQMVTLIVGAGVAVLVLIFVGALGGQTYNLVESDIASITNTTIKNNVSNSIASGFEALEQAGKFLPLIILAVVIALVLTIVLGFTAFGAGAARGGAL